MDKRFVRQPATPGTGYLMAAQGPAASPSTGTQPDQQVLGAGDIQPLVRYKYNAIIQIILGTPPSSLSVSLPYLAQHSNYTYILIYLCAMYMSTRHGG